MRIRRWLVRARRARLAHFALIGLALWAIAPAPPSDRVVLSPELVDALRETEERRGGDQDPVRRAVEDEVLYREALRLGLDRGDPIVRRRLVQKALLLAEDLGGAARPSTEAEIAAWFDANRERWRRPPAVSFVHVFSTKREDLAALALPDADEVPRAGAPFPLSRRIVRAPQTEIAGTYGGSFASTVASLPLGAWSEPIESTYGWHRVRVSERAEGRLPELAEVRGLVEGELLATRREHATREFVRRAVERYDVTVAGLAWASR